jgi:WD40 repeat protein
MRRCIFSRRASVLAAILLLLESVLAVRLGVAEEGGEALATLKGHRDGIYSVGFLKDGHVVASASRDGTIRLFDVESGDQQAELKGHEGQILRLALGGKNLLASAGADKSVRIWDLRDTLPRESRLPPANRTPGQYFEVRRRLAA